MPMDNSLSLEAFRRRASLGPPSTAGIPGGAMAARSPSAQNPLAGLTPQGPSMSAPGMAQLQKSSHGEAELIIKALSQRLKNLPPKV